MGYQPDNKGMAGSAVYSMIQRVASISARRAAVCWVTTQLARQARVELNYKRRIVVLKKGTRSLVPRKTYIHILSLDIRTSNFTVGVPFLGNSSGG